MTRDRNFARLVRARMRLTGERYTTARAELVAASVTARPPSREPKGHGHAPASHDVDNPMTGPQQVAVALYDAISTADWSAAHALLAPNVVGKVSDLVTAPEHRGAEALLEHLRLRRSVGDDSYRIDSWELQDHPQPGRFATVLIRHSAVVAGERISAEALHVLQVDDGQVSLFAASLPSGQIDGRWLPLVA